MDTLRLRGDSAVLAAAAAGGLALLFAARREASLGQARGGRRRAARLHDKQLRFPRTPVRRRRGAAAAAARPASGNPQGKVESVVIVGGGFSGLALARALRALSHLKRIVVIERKAEIGEIFSGTAVTPNGAKCLRKLGVDVDRLQRESHLRETYEDTFPILSKGGSVVSRLPSKTLETAHREPLMMLCRDDLLREIRQGLPAGGIYTGRRLVDYYEEHDGVVAVLDDGTHIKADLLVGADGTDSTVRSLMFGEATSDMVDYVGYTSYRGIVTSHDIFRHNLMAGGGFITSTPDANLLVSSLGQERVYWCLTIKSKPGVEEYEDEAALSGVKSRLLHDESLGKWHEPVPELVNGAGEIFRKDVKFFKNDLGTWSQGSVTLIGDACHPMCPELAQGANMGFEDAIKLAELIAEFNASDSLSLAGILESYYEQRHPRSSRVAHASLKLGAGIATESTLLKRVAFAAHQALLSMLPSTWLSGAEDGWIYEHEP